jgi:hypothetical protein
MFHPAAAVVKAGLVQFPDCCGDVRRTRAGPAAAVEPLGDEVVVVEPPAAVVVVVPALPPAVVGVVEPAAPGAVVVVEAPPESGVVALGGGSVPVVLVASAALDVPPPPVSPLIAMPTIAATIMAVRSCHVLHDRRSLILSSPR